MARGRMPVLSPTQVDAEPDEPDEPDGFGEPEAAGSRPDWLARGAKIGRYSVIECLGVGGMGIIYSAWDPKLDRKVAIKVVRGRHGNFGTTRGRARLLREGQALARLRHPNVITVHDVGTHEGRVFVAMEFVEGQTLQRWLLRSPRPPLAQLIDVFLQIGRGLAAAHRAGLVHRDVKPENVMIGDDGRVMVLDFGIAREGVGSESQVYEVDAADDDDDDDIDPDKLRAIAAGELELPDFIAPLDEDAGDGPGPQPDPSEAEIAAQPLLSHHTPLADLTRSGAVIGTPAYMSPEQHRGRPVDARSDQFSFCLAMWEAVHGEKPFGEGSRQKLLARMRLGQIKRPANREVPRRIHAALRRGLAWLPVNRFASMEELLEALNPRGRSLERRLRRGVVLGAAGGLAVGLAAALLVTSQEPAPADPAPACGQASFELVRDWNADRAEQLGRRFAATGLAHAGPSWLRTRERLDEWAARWVAARDQTCAAHFIEHRDSAIRHDRRVACLDRQRQRFVELLVSLETVDAGLVDRAVIATLRLPSPALCSNSAHLDDLDDRVPGDAGPSASRRRLAELRTELETVELSLATGLTRETRFAERGHAARLLARSRELVATARELDDPRLLARALWLEAHSLDDAGDPALAEAKLLESARLAAAVGDGALEVRSLTAAGEQIGVPGQAVAARRWLDLAEALVSRLPSPAPARVEVLVARAVVELRASRAPEARELLTAARTLIEDHAELEAMLPEVLILLARAQPHGEASVQSTRRAVAVASRVYGDHHPLAALTQTELGDALDRAGESEAALAAYALALTTWDSLDAPVRAAEARAQLSVALARQGRCDEAWTPLVRAFEDVRGHAPSSPALLASLASLTGACPEFAARVDDLGVARSPGSTPRLR